MQNYILNLMFWKFVHIISVLRICLTNAFVHMEFVHL